LEGNVILKIAISLSVNSNNSARCPLSIKVDNDDSDRCHDVHTILQNFSDGILSYVELIKKVNFNEVYQGVNFTEVLPELHINNEGYANLNENAILKDFNLSEDSYKNYTFENIKEEVLYNHINFNLYAIKEKFAELNKSKREVLISKLENIIYIDPYYYDNIDEFLDEYSKKIQSMIETIKQYNFFEIYPNIDFNTYLPDLNINEKGYPNLNANKILEQFHLTKEYYGNFTNYEIQEMINNNNNVGFNIRHIINTLNKLNDLCSQTLYKKLFKIIDDYVNDEYFEDSEYLIQEFSNRILSFINTLKSINFNEVYSGLYCSERLPELNINENGFATLNSDIILKSFHLTENNSPYNYLTIKDEVMNKNQNFNIKEILRKINLLQILSEKKVGSYLSNIMKIEISYEDRFVNSFKTKNGTMIVELNGTEKKFDKVTLSIGGKSSRTTGKTPLNLKIRGKNDLYGRKQFKLRGDTKDPSLLRSKLVCDIHNRLGLPSISANYITVLINDVDFGLYVLMDAFKLSWVEFEYGEKDTTTLYKCDKSNHLTLNTSINGCENENDQVEDKNEWIEFLNNLNNANSVNEIEKFFDVDQFLTEMVIDYLTGSWDHFLTVSHNFYLFKPKNDTWKYLSYDFDLDFGYNYEKINDNEIETKNEPIDGNLNEEEDIEKDRLFIKSIDKTYIEPPNYSFSDSVSPNHLFDILIFNNTTRFKEILKDTIVKVFNPETLYPHVDELKTLIEPYVELEKVKNSEGRYKGIFNLSIDRIYSLEEWSDNCEFTVVDRAYGIKYWILAKYRYLCKTLNMTCNPIYMDENFDIHN